jgi:hypothetical protein
MSTAAVVRPHHDKFFVNGYHFYLDDRASWRAGGSPLSLRSADPQPVEDVDPSLLFQDQVGDQALAAGGRSWMPSLGYAMLA